jgi:cardiolipin hydrolase
MTTDEFRQRLEATLGDLRLSRAERQALAAALADVAIDDARRAELRRTALGVARSAIQSSARPTDILTWLEDLLPLLDPPVGAQLSGTVCGGGVCFSPGEACRDRIAGMFRAARKSVDVCVFTITDDVIADALLEAHRRGVVVRVITDDQKSLDLGSDVVRFESAGVPVRVDRTKFHMHHKFAIFDGARLITGSYNWTLGAARDNVEHFVILEDPPLLSRFQAEFERLWRSYE